MKTIIQAPYTLAFLMGILAAIALPPLNALFLTFIAFSGLFYSFLKLRPQRLGLFSFCFMMPYFTIGLYWIGNALLVENNPYKWAWPIAVLGLPILLSLFFSAAGFISRKIIKSTDYNGAHLFFFANMIMLAEYARSFMFTGFPWNNFGITWISSATLSQNASLIGLLGLSWLTLILSAATAYIIYTPAKKKKALSGCVIVLCLAGLFIHGTVKINRPQTASKTNKYNIVAIQPNIPQHEKWDPLFIQRNIDHLIQITQKALNELDNKALPTLIIWPETALSFRQTDDHAFMQHILQQFKSGENKKLTFITGALIRDKINQEQKYTYKNAVLFYDRNANLINSYAKTHLVPFGEYIPFQEYIPLKTVTGFTGMSRGNGPRWIQSVDKDLSILTKICYEIIFSHEFALGKRKQKPYSAMIHITNDAWYGESSGPYQHFSIAQFRAIENNMYIFRAANKGVSTIIDPTGHVPTTTKINQAGYVAEEINIYKTNTSLYILLGDLPLIVLLLALLSLQAIFIYRKR